MPSRARESLFLLAIFGIGLALPLTASLVRPRADVSRAENRRLAGAPGLPRDAGGWAQWPERVGAWLDDHLAFRDPLIRAHAWLRVRALGVSPSPSLLVGRHGWFFLGSEAPLAQYRGLASPEEAAIRRWEEVLLERHAWLAARGVAYVVTVAPNKHSIYGDELPAWLTRVGPSTLDRLAERLRAHPELGFVDLRPPLRRARASVRVYHKTDTHWNDVGAYVAYRELLAALAARVPALADARPVPVRPRRRLGPGLGLVRAVGLEGTLREELLERLPARRRSRVAAEHRTDHAWRVEAQLPFATEVSDESLPTAVVFRDSFANALVPFLSEHFRRALWVWLPHVDPAVVEAQRPDVVIQEIAERFLEHPPRGPAELAAEAASARTAPP